MNKQRERVYLAALASYGYIISFYVKNLSKHQHAIRVSRAEIGKLSAAAARIYSRISLINGMILRSAQIHFLIVITITLPTLCDKGKSFANLAPLQYIIHNIYIISHIEIKLFSYNSNNLFNSR